MAFPSDFLTLQNSVINKLRLASNDRDKVKDWINQVYAQACSETEAFVANAILPVTPNFASYSLPPSTLRIKSITAAAPGDGYGAPLAQISLDEMLTLRQTAQAGAVNNGTSTRYALAGMKTLELYPTPTSADSILIYYTYLPNPLVDDTDVPEIPEPFATKLLEFGATAEAADFVGDPDQDRYRTLFENWMAKFRTHLNRHRGAATGQLRILGAPLVTVGRDIDTGC